MVPRDLCEFSPCQPCPECKRTALGFDYMVVLMKSCFGGENRWSRYLLVLLPLVAVVAGLALLLTFLWRFDLTTSPAWQVGIYPGMLALLLSTTFVVSSFPPLCLGQGLRWFLVGLALLVPVVVFSAGWILTGPYSGFRDDRIFDLVVVSVGAFMLIWTFITFPIGGFLLGRDLVRLRRRGMGLSGLLRFPSVIGIG